MEHRIQQLGREVIGESPDSETYETYTAKSKMMELSFFENDNRFELFIERIDGKGNVPGETTALFAEMVKKMQSKANELGQPVKLQLDPVKAVIKDWAETRAAAVIGGWDSIGGHDRDIFRKTFYPEKV